MSIRSRREVDLDQVLGAIADQTRRQLLNRLAAEPATITELAAPFAMSLPAVSKHLRVLERAGLIRREIDGRIHRCFIVPERLQSVQAWLDNTRAYWEQSLDSLERHVANA